MDQIDGEERPKILNNLFLLDFNIIMYFLLILNFLNYMLTHECMVGWCSFPLGFFFFGLRLFNIM